MTVMPASGEVADKAVSTEDASSNVEVARLEAVLAALVENKVESMKAAATTTTTTTRRAGSAPASPRRPRLTSSSTASSSQNHYHHHHYHHHHHHHNQQQNHHHKHEKKKRENRRHRRHDSAPCGEFIEDLVSQAQNHHRTRNGKGCRRDSEQPHSPRKRRRHSKSPQGAHGPPILQNVMEGPGRDAELGLLGIDRDQQLDLLKFERAREAFGDSHALPRLQQSSCCLSQSATQLKIHYDVDEYVALNLEDELDEEEDSHNGKKKRRGPCDKYHRPKRKRKRRRRRIGPEGAHEELPDPEELPPRARWTIVATACLLLAMSLLLVGVTLRMAPIIDDMGDGRRASVCRKNRPRRGSTVRRKDSVQPGKTVAENVTKVLIPPLQSPGEIRQDRNRRKIVMIVLGIFIFLLAASVLVVVITLTHSSFHRLPNESSANDSDTHHDTTTSKGKRRIV